MVDFDSPLIRRSFGGQNIDLVCLFGHLPKTTSIPCLFSLGSVLLELWYRESFEDPKIEAERTMCIGARCGIHITDRRQLSR